MEFATNHTASVQECLTRILGAEVPPKSWEVANLPLSLGGLGLPSAPRVSPAAYWSSWADCLQTTALREPAVAEQLTTALSNGEGGSYLGSAVAARDRLVEAGFQAPVWADLTVNNLARPRGGNFDDVEPGTRPGWQQQSPLLLEERFVSDSLWPRLTPQRNALFRSQGGPMASVPYTCFPIASTQQVRPSAFQSVAPPSSLAARNCRCGLPLDSCGRPPSSLCCSRGAGSPALCSGKCSRPYLS